MKKYVQFLLIGLVIQSAITNLIFANNWISTNGPYGANIKSISYDSDTKTIYLGTFSDGIYKSTNSGEKWYSMHDDFLTNTTAVNSIFIENESSLIAVTDSIGLLRKENNSRWTPINTGFGGHLSFKTMAKLSDDVYLVGSNGRAVFKSTNRGQSWSNYYDGLQINEVVNSILKVDNKVLIGTNNGIYKSTDEGKKWQVVKEQIGNVNVIIYTDKQNVLLAGSNKGLFVSYDKGETWINKKDESNANLSVQSLVQIDTTVFIGTKSNGLYSASINNFNLEKIDINLPSASISALGNIDNNLFIGNHFCLITLKDSSFEYKLNGIGVRSINSFLNVGNDVYSATDMGVYRTSNDGISWIQMNSGFSEITQVNSLLLSKSGVLLAGTNGDGLYYSEDLGNNWIKNTNSELTSIRINQLEIDSSGMLYAGTIGKGVFKSDDGGISWFQMFGDNIEETEILSFTVTKDGLVFAGTSQNGLYIKSNYDDWRKQDNSNLPSARSIYSLEYMSNNEDGVLIASTNVGLFMSYSNGNSWAKLESNLLNPAKKLYLSSDSILYSALNYMNGIYISKDFGTTWQQEVDNSGLYARSVSALIESNRGFIYAGAKSSNCFRTLGSNINIPKKEPKLTVIGKTSFCDDYFCVLDAGEGWFNYKWSNGSVSRFDTVWKEGEYWFTANDSLGLKVNSDTVLITVHPKPEKPRLLYNEEILFCNVDVPHYKWYFENELIENASEKTYKPEKEGWYKCEVFTEFLCTNISEDYKVEFPISIVNSENSFEFYPNPANDYIYFKNNAGCSVEIYNEYSQLVKEQKINANDKLWIGNLATGTYFMKIVSDNLGKEIFLIEKIIILK